jgi:hypothetical protein
MREKQLRACGLGGIRRKKKVDAEDFPDDNTCNVIQTDLPKLPAGSDEMNA